MSDTADSADSAEREEREAQLAAALSGASYIGKLGRGTTLLLAKQCSAAGKVSTAAEVIAWANGLELRTGPFDEAVARAKAAHGRAERVLKQIYQSRAEAEADQADTTELAGLLALAKTASRDVDTYAAARDAASACADAVHAVVAFVAAERARDEMAAAVRRLADAAKERDRKIDAAKAAAKTTAAAAAGTARPGRRYSCLVIVCKADVDEKHVIAAFPADTQFVICGRSETVTYYCAETPDGTVFVATERQFSQMPVVWDRSSVMFAYVGMCHGPRGQIHINDLLVVTAAIGVGVVHRPPLATYAAGLAVDPAQWVTKVPAEPEDEAFKRKLLCRAVYARSVDTADEHAWLKQYWSTRLTGPLLVGKEGYSHLLEDLQDQVRLAAGMTAYCCDDCVLM